MRAIDRIIMIFESLKSKETKEKYRTTETAFTRKGKFLFIDLCLLMLFKKGQSLTMEMINYFKLHKLEIEIEASKQAFSQRRDKLNAEVFIDHNDEYIRSIYQETNYKTFNGKYIVCAIDGSDCEIPNTEELKGVFGKARDVARCKLSGLYDVLNNIMIDTIITNYDSSERNLAKENILAAKNKLVDKELLIIFDRGYPSIEMIYWLNKNGVKFIIRSQDNTYNKEKENMTSDDEVINIEITPNRLTGKMCDDTKKRITTIRSTTN